MDLSKVLEGVSVSKMFQTLYGKMVVTHDVQVRGIQYDSRKVGRDEIFVAIRGVAVDGHKFMADAVQRGATVVVMEDDGTLPDAFFMHAGVIKVVVGNSRKALATMSANFYGHPSRQLQLIGITGTNGKTTTTHLIKSILETNGQRVGLIGTIEYKVGSETIPATHTTPESLELNQLLAQMVAKDCTAAVMEVSSHSLALHRVHGLEFAIAGFTNLTQDHLDFHSSMEEYFTAKKMLFDGLKAGSHAVTNSDDGYGYKMIEGVAANTLTYGITSTAEVAAKDVQLSVSGTECSVVYKNEVEQVHSPLIGRFNVQNILAAYAVSLTAGVPRATISRGIESLKSVRGRFEQLRSPGGWTAIVDYAHTPDALANSLRAIHDILPAGSKAKIITIFGCGGNRDRGKRPQMGRIATEQSDLTIITSDNSRNEDPDSIIEDIVAGAVSGRNFVSEVDRRKAIALGLQSANSGDVVLIAGKGHEDYQVVGDAKTHFSDREEVESFIRNAQ
jgi:UDP-N-acetylmuramoyl-L-alanyl-D-glutamate--2,6-diaminopimelate ligase